MKQELDVITNLLANEETKKDMYGATGFQTLNIVKTSVEPEISQVDEQDEFNVHYGTNTTSKNMGHKSKQKNQYPVTSKTTNFHSS